ncbi:MAG: carboxypeptidase regulatory-like domain-containing protein [Anaeromyxobacter sp.]|nr:carboxypeptidase regulatory-like domain-containing protein [Anaeromyxobacter sp.]MBL0275525.1 carboxypeptidase regulatory-like domain-containing protein [Anaeromyxobacter sp.]
MRRPAVLVLAAVLLAALGVTLWLVRELRTAADSSDVALVPPSQRQAPPALAPEGAADHLPSRATATPGAPGRVEGLVADPAGVPLAGVRVALSSRADGALGLPPVEVRSGFDGRYAFDGVEPGRAVLLAAQDGVALGTSRAVQVAAGRPAQVDLALSAPGTLSGRVSDASGPTVVVVVPLHAGPGAGQVARAPVAPDGAYSLALPAGQYRVHAAPASSPRLDLRVAPAFAAVAAARITRLDLVASPATAEAGVAVKVLEPGGAPSGGAAVTVSRAGEARVAFAASTGEDGVLVLASQMGMAGQPVTLAARNGGRTGTFTGSLPASGEVVVPLAPGGAVEGRLSGGGPVGAFTLTVSTEPSPGGWRIVEAQRLVGDRFDLGDLPPEVVRLAVRTEDGRAGQLEVRLSPGQVAQATVVLRPVAPTQAPPAR